MMQVREPKKGYKRARINLRRYEEIPIDWNVVPLQNLIKDIQTGFAEGERDENGILQLRMNNISDDGTLNFDKTLKVPIPSDIEKYDLKKNDVLFNNTNSLDLIGKSTIIKKDLDYTFSNHITRIRTKDRELVSYFLTLLLLKYKRDTLFRSICNTHVGQSGIGKGELLKIGIIYPSVPEQQRIALILSNIDSLIQQTQNIVEQTQRLKKGLTQRLLTKGIGHTKFKKIQLGFRFIQTEIPETWSVLSLKDLSQDGLMNGIFKKADEFGSGVPLVNVTDLFSEYDITLESLEKVKVTKKELEQFGIKSGDMFFCRSSLVRDGIGRSNIVLDLTEPSVFECHVMMLRPNSLINPKFLFYFTRSKLFKKYLLTIAMTLTMTTIRQPDLELAMIPIPSLDEQSTIVSILSGLDSKIMQLQNEKSKFENLKKGLMQKLLTGQMRVKA